MKYIIVDGVHHELSEITQTFYDANTYVMKFRGTYDEVTSFLYDDVEWAIQWEDGRVEDCSSYCVVDNVLDKRDGYIQISMREQTDLEEAYELLYGITWELEIVEDEPELDEVVEEEVVE